MRRFMRGAFIGVLLVETVACSAPLITAVGPGLAYVVKGGTVYRCEGSVGEVQCTEVAERSR